MVKTIVIAVLAVIAALLIYAATKPDTFALERSTSIKAPPEKIFALFNDFHHWTAWSPWEKLDPALKRTYSGAEAGKGAVYEWEGNNKVGKGRMEIEDSVAPSKVAIDLHFLKPFEARNVAEFTLASQGDATNVTWKMHGPSPYLSKVMTLFFSMDKMVGKDFETGLANLKAVAEQ